MKMGTLVVALVVAGVNIAGIVWLTGGVDAFKVADKSSAQSPEALPISETGPWPKAVVPEDEHNFDVMTVGAQKSHKFVIKNEGDVPLQYKLIGTSCSCTVSDMESKKVYEIPVGEQREIELTWKPREFDDQFSKTAEIYTNDPERQIVTFSVVGRVEEILSSNPVEGWPLQDIDRNNPVTLTGEIYSSILEEIAIEKIDVSKEWLKVTSEPFSKTDLEEFNAKCGHKIKVVFDPADLNVGKIAELVTVHTKVDEAKEIPFAITGNFLGPITARPYRPEGTKAMRYHPEFLHIDIGQFPASKGGKGWYKLIIADMPEGLEFEATEIEPSLGNVKVTVKRQASPPQSKHQFAIVEFEVLPGVTTGTYQKKNSVKIKVKTNHPKAKELKFYLEFIAI